MTAQGNPAGFEIDAGREEVDNVIQQLPPDKSAALVVARGEASDPFAASPRRDLPSYKTIIEFTGEAVASGAAYDIAKQLAELLEKHFKGRFRRTKDDSPPDDT